jgi:hypothetical protein
MPPNLRTRPVTSTRHDGSDPDLLRIYMRVKEPIDRTMWDGGGGYGCVVIVVSPPPVGPCGVDHGRAAASRYRHDAGIQGDTGADALAHSVLHVGRGENTSRRHPVLVA